MLVSFIPITFFYILLFSPQESWELSQNQLFWWMFLCATFTRIGITLFEVPHRSFGAEISNDYHERTKLFSWRELFAWTAGISNAFFAYFVFFRSTPEYPQGQLNPEAYFDLALLGGFVMAITKPPSNAKSKYASGFSCPCGYSGVDLKKTKYAKKAFDIPAVHANNSRHENNFVLS